MFALRTLCYSFDVRNLRLGREATVGNLSNYNDDDDDGKKSLIKSELMLF